LRSAKNIFAEFHQGLETVSQLIDAGKIECDISRGGYLKVAHTQALAVKMQEQAVIQQTDFSDKVEFCDAERIKQQFMCNPQAFAGMYYPDYFSLNPLKLAQGYARLATDSGVQVYPNSPVIDWSEEGGKQRLSTPQGSVVCDKVIIATNGYTGKKQHALIKDRHFPVLSSVIVTRPLSNQERELIGMQAGLMVMDTRPMKYYYRLLPDGRLLFGGRGAIQGKDADKKVYAEGLLKALLATFPQLEQLTVKYFWSGWVSVSYDDYPRIFANQDHSVLYAMGYCGSGLSFSTQAGKRLAEKLAGKQTLPALPYGQSPLPKFPMAPMRRLGLSLYYKWAQLKT
jgi:glycine/D-amino acid oxidase-like deaminating enzyme